MTYTLSERVKALQKLVNNYPTRMAKIAKDATIRAVEKAAELTPPTGGDLAGTNTRAGEMKEHWDSDSQRVPQRRGNDYVTTLANNKKYASYVNDGHRMDRHFVPGLYVNPGSGLLEYDQASDKGLVVGTKTFYVEGLHMVDEAKKEYERVAEAGLKRLAKEAEQ